IQSVREIHVPHHAPEPFTLVVLVVVVIAKEVLFRYLQLNGKSIDSNALQTDAWHHRSDSFTSLAAFIGISIALAGGERYWQADAWGPLLSAPGLALHR